MKRVIRLFQRASRVVVWRFSISFVAMLLTSLSSTVSLWAQNNISQWSPPVNFSNVADLVSYAPVLLCDDKQNTHMFWAERGDTEAFIYYSTDASGSWSQPIDIIASQRVDLLHVAITPDERVHLIWVIGNFGDLVYTSAPLAEARDTRKWAVPRALDSDVNVLSNVYSGSNMLFADSAGNLHLVYSRPNDSNGISNSLYYRRSPDGGDTWSSPSQIVTIVAPEPSSMTGNVSVDGAGRVHVVWEVRSYEYQSFSQLGYFRSVDGGATWEGGMELATGSRPFGVAMAAVYTFDRDEVHLTWDVPARLHRWSNDGGQTWSSTSQIIDLGAAYGGHNKLAKDSAGILHAVAAVGAGVYHTAWRDGSWEPGEAIDTRSFDPHGQQLVVCQGNRLHVAYYDRTAENEIWYSSRTVDAPERVRQAIPAPKLVPAPLPLESAGYTATVDATAATPSLGTSSLQDARPSPVNSWELVGTTVGMGASGILVLGVVVVRLLRRRR